MKFYAALIGAKGDLKHQHECGFLTRSYYNLGRTNRIMMCSLCHAGAEGYDHEDCAEQPSWYGTLFSTRPWIVPPPLASAPYDHGKPEDVFKLDMLHLFKVGLGRHICASAIAALCLLGFWDSVDDSKNLPDRLARAHASFRLWCLAEREQPGLRSFTVAFFTIKSRASFPWSNSKGSDTTLMLRWLRFLTALELQQESPFKTSHEVFLRKLKHAVEHGLEVFRVLHNHGLWLERNCAKLLYGHLMLLLRSYKAMARACQEKQIAGFSLVPKFHAIHHVAVSIGTDIRSGAAMVLNPLYAGCEMNEDFVGRLSRLSRKLATKTLTRRVLQRHLFKKKAVTARHVRVQE